MIGGGMSIGAVATRSVLDLGFDFNAGVLPPGATLTRGSTGARVNAAGALSIEPADGARFDHDPLTLAPRGLMLEPAATNVLPQSATTAGWTYTTVTRGAGISPAGAPELASYAMAAGTAIHRIARSVGDGVGAWTLTAHVRGSAGVPIIGIAREAVAWFNTQTGQWLATGGFTAANATPLGDGAWRLSVGYELAAGAGTAIFLYASNRAQTTPLPGFAGGEECWLGGIQIEGGGSATSPIATGAASATRAADVLTLDLAGKGVADGPVAARLTFDDLSTEDVMLAVSGGTAQLTFASWSSTRMRLRRIARAA